MIEIMDVSKSFDGNKVLDNISCQIDDGTILGIVGSNGAGKSTLLRIMCGVYDIKQGSVIYEGVNLDNKLNYAPDILFLSDDMYYESGETIHSMAKRYRLFYKNFSNKKYDKLLSLFNLDKKKRIGKLSKGMKKQAFLSIALACDAKYLLLDETLDGLDPLMRINAKKLIFEETIKRQMVTVITSHSLKELEDMCDSLSMLHKGKVILRGYVDDFKSQFVKVRCAFEGQVVEEGFEDIDIESFECSGRIYTIIAKGDVEKIKDEVSKLNPILIEVIPITIEEIFVIKLKKTGYGKINLEEI